ncbi:glycine cleavage system protein H [Streptomyces turgidiscabies]|nr:MULTISPECIES: glycine cleavage system H protein [Streptomyces]MDX3492905.1 glycine cleavage system protein H [Streptomyces turgidiscabies]GAQ74277.1 glycine cleavage system H protein [Streptomyces turgidiscabies]
MSDIREGLKYTAEHLWVRTLGDGLMEVGITDHAQRMLGDINDLDLPQAGAQVKKGESAGSVEANKGACDFYAPVSGEVVAVNAHAAQSPGEVHADPYGTWLFRIKPVDSADTGDLLDAATYENEMIG